MSIVNPRTVITFSFALSRLGSDLTPTVFSVLMTVNEQNHISSGWEGQSHYGSPLSILS